MNVARSTLLRHALISLLLPLALICCCGESALAVARAGESPPSGTALTGRERAAAKSPPTLVREVEASRTAESSTYLLSDGTRRAEIFDHPIHYREGSAWREIDPTLVADGPNGDLRTRATGISEVFSEGKTQAPVAISGPDWSLGMRLLGGNMHGLVAIGDKAIYPLALTGTQLTYEARADGLKETLVLDSPEAPDTFTFFVSLKGLTLHAEPLGGGYALYHDGAPAGIMEPLSVFDSADNGSSRTPAVCSQATMKVVPAPGGAYVTYRVPRAWLDDRARVYPVYVDPAVTFAGPSTTRNDTYVSQGGGTHYSENHLDASLFSATDLRRALVNFNLNSVPTGSTINSANLQLYLWQNSSGGNFTMDCDPVVGSWNYAATWANTFGNRSLSRGAGGDWITIAPGANRYVTWNMTTAVQNWFSGLMPNNGFVVLANNESAVSQHAFWSSEYTTFTSRQPHLVVDYTPPSVTVDPLQPAYRSGDEVRVTVHARSRIVSNLQMKVEGRPVSGGSEVSVQFAFSATPPGAGWTSLPVQGGYLSYYRTAEVALLPNPGIVPDLEACSTNATTEGRDVTFVYRIGTGLGDIQNNRVSTFAADWQTAWQDQGVAYSILAGTTKASASTTASAQWFVERDLDADGLSETRDDSGTAGRGSVTLEWSRASCALGYNVYVHDGNRFRWVATTPLTTWTTAGKGLYPTDSSVAALAPGTTANPFASGAGLDLRDDPRPLYAKTAGSSMDGVIGYAFKVVPYNNSGEAPFSDIATVTVALEGRTQHAAEELRHPGFALGDLFGHSAMAQLDDGSVDLDVTDLSLPSLGPDAALSRHYSSTGEAGARFAPGWRFDFERSVSATTPGIAAYVDQSGDAHRFTQVNGVWVSPSGSCDILTGSPSGGWTLLHKDLSTEAFDEQGRLIGEADTNGNSVRYEWAQDTLTIRAPGDTWLLHERRITVGFSDGKIVSATLQTPDGERVVRYSQNATSAVVTSFPGTSAEKTIVYGYTGGRITSIAIPGFEPSSQRPAVWAIGYGSSGASLTVENVTGAATPTMRREFAIDASGRTATTTLAGVLCQTLTWNPLGLEASRSEPATSWTTTHRFDTLGNEIGSTSPSGRVTSGFFDGRGNRLSFTDEGGRTTKYAYSRDRCVREEDARGSVTTRAFDARGNLLSESKTLDASGTLTTSNREYAQDDGRLLRERSSIDARTESVTEYGDYADCGEAQQTTHVGVRLSAGPQTTDLVEKRTFDGFGNLTTVTDALGTATTRNTYDAAARVVESSDARGVVTHTRYGPLGGPSEVWRSHADTSTIVGWNTYCYDGAGHLATEVLKATDGSTVSTTTHTYDAAGRETKTNDTLAPGEFLARYDEQGHVGAVWAEGADVGQTSASTRIAYNAEGEQTSVTDPGCVGVSATVSYNADGSVAREVGADGSQSLYKYNQAGDTIAQESAVEGGTSKVLFAVDLDGRITSETSLADGSTTTRDYDLQGEEVTTALNGQAPSSVKRNTLGWELERTGADGVVTQTTYDACGRVVRIGRGGAVTTSGYHACGELLSTGNADGSSAEYRFDCFGRKVLELQRASGVDLSRIVTSYDTAGRTAVSRDEVTGLRKEFTYTAAGGVETTESRPGGAIVSSVADGTGLQRSLSATVATTNVGWSIVATDLAGRATDSTSTTLIGQRARRYDDVGRVVSDAIGSYSFAATGPKRSEAYSFPAFGIAEQNVYAYDASGRLNCATVSGTATTYEYVPGSGALRTSTGSGGATSLEYDPAGHLESAKSAVCDRVYASDALGRRVSSGTSENPTQTVLAWTGDRLMAVRSGAATSLYTYDANGRRVRTVTARGSSTATTSFTYDGIRLLSVGAVEPGGTESRVDYLYDNAGVCAGIYRTSGCAPLAFSVVTSDRGDVRELLDSAGAPFVLYSYDAFGNPLSLRTKATSLVPTATASQVAERQPLRYGGYVYDAETGLYYCSARYYDPAVAAFVSADPVRADGERSAYQYCSGDPVGKVDDTGFAAKPKLKTGPLSASDYDGVREQVIYNSMYVVTHSKGYAPDNHTQGYKDAPNGYTDCSGLVTYVMWRAGVFAKSTISNWNSRAIYDQALTKSTRPNNNYFDAGRKTKWRIGDIVQSDAPANHVAVIVRDSPDPYIAESSPTYRGPAIHKLSKRKKPWRYQHAGRYFSLKKN